MSRLHIFSIAGHNKCVVIARLSLLHDIYGKPSLRLNEIFQKTSHLCYLYSLTSPVCFVSCMLMAPGSMMYGCHFQVWRYKGGPEIPVPNRLVCNKRGVNQQSQGNISNRFFIRKKNKDIIVGARKLLGSSYQCSLS